MKHVICVAVLFITTFVTASARSTPRATADDLLAADRAFAAAAMKTDVVSALSAMFAPDGKIPPGQPFFTIWKRDSTKDRWLYIAE